MVKSSSTTNYTYPGFRAYTIGIATPVLYNH